MTQQLVYSADSPPNIAPLRPEPRMAWTYERELEKHRAMETALREALARDEVLLRQKEKLLEEQRLLSKESDHRLLNGLQMILSLLLLQSRASTNAEVASQLAVAAKRVATIERVHRRLHGLDRVQTVAFKQYLEELCRDFTTILSTAERPEPVIVVTGREVELPTATGIPLGLIASELITNAAKHGKGRISVSLEPDPPKGYALSVANDGPALPEGFDPAAGKGLGMKIIRALVGQIDGELRIGRGDGDQGARFTVLFA